MPATLAMPTSVPEPRSRIALTKGAKVSYIAVTFTSTMRLNTCSSPVSPVTVPALIPALAITTSGAPSCATKARAAPASAARSVTSIA